VAGGAGGGGAGSATGSTTVGGGGEEVIGPKRGGSGLGRGKGVRGGAVEGGAGGARWSLGGASGSLMRLMTFSESCKVEEKFQRRNKVE